MSEEYTTTDTKVAVVRSCLFSDFFSHLECGFQYVSLVQRTPTSYGCSHAHATAVLSPSKSATAAAKAFVKN
jgi:hypothetical protein